MKDLFNLNKKDKLKILLDQLKNPYKIQVLKLYNKNKNNNKIKKNNNY